MPSKTASANINKFQILERGNIYFFYRPKVTSKQAQEKTNVQNEEDIQRFFFILQPENSSLYRLIFIGEKKLPTIESMHEKDWAMVDFVTADKQALINLLNEQTYSTQTRGERLLPAVRPAGEGVYGIIKQDRNTYLAYNLELPEKRREVQETLEIERQATYVLSIKNPEMPGKRSSKPVNYPPEFKEKFKNLRFISAEPPELLNYEGTELLLIGANTDIADELREEIKEQRENINTADIFNELNLWKKEHPISPLFEGHWV